MDKAKQLRAVLVFPNRDLARDLTDLLQTAPEVHIAADLLRYPDPKELTDRIRFAHPDAIFVDVSTDIEAALGVLEAIANDSPQIATVAMDSGNDPQHILRCLRAGAAEFLHSPLHADDVQQAVARMVKRKVLDQPETDQEAGQVLAFAPVKGGSGATTLACNIADRLRRRRKGEVLLMDMDLKSGLISFLLRCNHAYGTVDALRNATRLDESLWQSLIVRRDGLDVLTAPERPEAELFEAFPVQEVLDYARSHYAFVILDLDGVSDPVSLACVGASDDIYLICASAMPSLYMMRRTLPFLEELGCAREQMHVVVNRYDKRSELSLADMQKIFRSNVELTFPEDTAGVDRATRDGAAVADNSELGKATGKFVKDLVGAESSKSSEGGGFRNLRVLLGG